MAYVHRAGQAFAAQIGEEVLQIKDFTKRVWQESIFEFVYSMQLPVYRGGHMPVRTGFLRSSLMVSTSPVAYETVKNPNEKARYTWFPTEFERVVMSAKVGVNLYIGYMASYTWYAEHGNGAYPGHGFQRLAVQRWPTIVDQVIARLQTR